jgi:hypothetical protein
MADGMDFKINVSNYFGVDHERYLDNLQAYAITKPSQYMKMRSVIIDKVKKENMETMYKLFYNLLTTGTENDGRTSLVNVRGADAEWIQLFVPNMSKQQVSEIALGAVKTMNGLIDNVMEDLIPKNFLNISHTVTKKNTEGGLFQDK